MLSSHLKRWRDVARATLFEVGLTPARGLVVGALLLFVMQNAQVTYFAAENADSRAVISALDDDAGNAIDVVGRSRWVTDNGFASYGPVYFRVASTLGAWLSPLGDPATSSPSEARTRADHLALMLTSVLSVALLAILLASLFTRRAWFTLVLATAFEWALLKSHVWQYLILKAHPDQLLAVVVAGAALITLRNWQDPENTHLRRLSAWGWGVALATKASVIFFTPCVGLAFLWTQPCRRLKRAAAYVGHVALAYFLIGFPQNFNLPRLYRFLKYQSGYSKPATVDSVREWLALWGDQLMYPLALGLILLVVQRRGRRPPAREWICAAAVAVVPLLLLLPQKILPPHDHYPIPVVATQLTLLFAMLARPERTWSPRAMTLTALAIVGALYIVGLTPPGFDAILASELRDRPAARHIFAEVRARSERGERLYLDPYVPAFNKMPGVTVNWRTTRHFIAAGDFDAMVLNRPYYSRYSNPEKSDYVDVYNADAAATREFYLMFKDQPTRIDDPEIGVWQRLEQSGPWEIWTRARAPR